MSAFIGEIVRSNQKATVEVPDGAYFQLTNAALKGQPGNKAELYAESESGKYLLCTLTTATTDQHHLDIAFPDDASFSVAGQGEVHLTGYLRVEDLPPEFSEDEEEVSNHKTKRSFVDAEADEGSEDEDDGVEDDDDDDDFEDEDEGSDDEDDAREDVKKLTAPKAAVAKPGASAGGKPNQPTSAGKASQQAPKQASKPSTPAAGQSTAPPAKKQKTAGDSGELKCEPCGKPFPNANALTQHNAAKHKAKA